MLNKVDKHSGIPAYLQIMNQVKKEIILGNLKNGDQLPPVRKMQKIFGVNINTVTRALEKLSFEGKLEAQHGVGYFITSEENIGDEVFSNLKKCINKLKESDLDLKTSLLLFEEVWKNESND
jgi:GntR family transcriptional regulator